MDTNLVQCPVCKYRPRTNEFDWCEAPGRFYGLPIELVQPQNEGDKMGREPQRTPLIGCPSCGVVFLNV